MKNIFPNSVKKKGFIEGGYNHSIIFQGEKLTQYKNSSFVILENQKSESRNPNHFGGVYRFGGFIL